MGNAVKVAVLMTCHNRRPVTLRCLQSLTRAIEERSVDVSVFLTDDGSTDGTSDAVREWCDSIAHHASRFTLHLIRSDGADYWARGMARAWQAALDCEQEQIHSPTPTLHSKFTHFLWINDDAVLKPDSLSALLDLSTTHPNAVINGTLVDSSGTPVYGLNVRNIGLAGNCVLVPRVVFEKVGMICGRYAHAWADRDYGMQVEKAGFGLVSAGVVGTTEWHVHRPSLKRLSLRERIALLRDPKGWNVHDLWLLRSRNWNVLYAVVSCVHMIAHVVIGER